MNISSKNNAREKIAARKRRGEEKVGEKMSEPLITRITLMTLMTLMLKTF